MKQSLLREGNFKNLTLIGSPFKAFAQEVYFETLKISNFQYLMFCWILIVRKLAPFMQYLLCKEIRAFKGIEFPEHLRQDYDAVMSLNYLRIMRILFLELQSIPKEFVYIQHQVILGVKQSHLVLVLTIGNTKVYQSTHKNSSLYLSAEYASIDKRLDDQQREITCRKEIGIYLNDVIHYEENFESRRLRRDLNPPNETAFGFVKLCAGNATSIARAPIDKAHKLLDKNSYAINKERRRVKSWLHDNEFKWDRFRFGIQQWADGERCDDSESVARCKRKKNCNIKKTSV